MLEQCSLTWLSTFPRDRSEGTMLDYTKEWMNNPNANFFFVVYEEPIFRYGRAFVVADGNILWKLNAIIWEKQIYNEAGLAQIYVINQHRYEHQESLVLYGYQSSYNCISPTPMRLISEAYTHTMGNIIYTTNE